MISKIKMWAVYGQNDDTACMSVDDKNADSVQVRRQEFPEGVRQLASRVAQLASGGPGTAQGPQKLWGIWTKTLLSRNLQALYSNFRKVLFFKTDF